MEVFSNLRLPNTTIFFNCKQLIDMYIQIYIFFILFILKSERLHVNKVSIIFSLSNGYITDVMLWKHLISTKCCVQVLTNTFKITAYLSKPKQPEVKLNSLSRQDNFQDEKSSWLKSRHYLLPGKQKVQIS